MKNIEGNIAIIDCETTGLADDDEIWEFACIIPDDDQAIHIHIRHEVTKAERLPEKYRADHAARYKPLNAVQPAAAAALIHSILEGKHLVGVNPTFDDRMLTRLLRDNGLEPSWHYHLIDLSAMTIGYILGCDSDRRTVTLPWKSDHLAQWCGVTGDYARHTAMGDVEWAYAWWKELTQ